MSKPAEHASAGQFLVLKVDFLYWEMTNRHERPLLSCYCGFTCAYTSMHLQRFYKIMYNIITISRQHYANASGGGDTTSVVVLK